MKSMNIAFNCRPFLNKQYTGIGRYAYHLVKSLSEIDSANRYTLYVKRNLFSLKKRLPRFNAKNFHMKVDQLNRGVAKSIGRVDIYHAPSPDALTLNNGTKMVMTVHDLIFKTFPKGHTQQTLAETEKQFKNIGERVAKIICCSKSTMRDLQKYFQIKQEDIALVYQGVDKSIFYMIGREEEEVADAVIKSKGIDQPFILSVGTIEPRKNLKNILHAFDRIRRCKKFKGKLVVIGMQGWMNEDVDQLVRKLELKDHIFFMGHLKDCELRYFYNKAEALVFPSFYEGFGFPIVEAFCCGTPVITSNVSSCPEVAGDAAVICDPYDPDDIAVSIGKVIGDEHFKQELREKGFKRAGDFNFRKTAYKTLDVYKEVYRM